MDPVSLSDRAPARRWGAAAVLSFMLVAPVSCSSSSSSAAPLATGDAQTPPIGGAAIEAWLVGGAYKQWRCESQMHGPRSPSLHGLGRICANEALVMAAAGDPPDAWPVGAAAVEETYQRATDPYPTGYAVYVKTSPDAEDGSDWYWYARVPTDDTKLAHDARGIAADGFGNEGAVQAACVTCHNEAGSDRDHTPSQGGRRPVYTPFP